MFVLISELKLCLPPFLPPSLLRFLKYFTLLLRGNINLDIKRRLLAVFQNLTTTRHHRSLHSILEPFKESTLFTVLFLLLSAFDVKKN